MPAQGLTYGPLEVFQQGLYVGMRVDVEHPDYEAFRAAQREAAGQIPEHVIETRERIAELAALLHAFDVIFALWSYVGRPRPGTLRPVSEDGGPFIAEYVAHVLLDRRSPEPLRTPTPRR